MPKAESPSAGLAHGDAEAARVGLPAFGSLCGRVQSVPELKASASWMAKGQARGAGAVRSPHWR